MIRRYELTDEQFAEIADLLPKPGRRGGRWNDHRTTLTASSGGFTAEHSGARCPSVMASGRACTSASTSGGLTAPWAASLHACTGASTQRAAWTSSFGASRHQHPRQPCGGRGEAGKNQPYDPAEQTLGRSRGGWGTKTHLVVDGHGRPLAATITAGQAHERKPAAPTLEQVRLPNVKGRPTCRPRKLAGDKGYSCPAVRAYLRRRGILPVIPTRKNQRGNPRFDQAAYKRRNVIERCVGWLKENRQLATRPGWL